MVPILYEDKDIIVVQKPAGLESQVSRGFAPDMVSEIRRYLHNPQDIHNHPQGVSTAQPPYVGVIHRLDKPVEGNHGIRTEPEIRSIIKRRFAGRKNKKIILGSGLWKTCG